jgi:methyl-accepting chemotaxis protein
LLINGQNIDGRFFFAQALRVCRNRIMIADRICACAWCDERASLFIPALTESEGMMNIQGHLRRALGLVLVIVAALSLVIDAAGVVQIWMLREPVTQDAINTLDLMNSTLDTTAQGLGIVKTSLKSVTDTIGALQSTVASAAATIDHASNSVSSLSSIVGQNLSATINSALGTLDAVQNTTKTLDEFLASISQLPFINFNYNPAKPLSASVSELTAKLADVPKSLDNLKKNLTESGNSLDQVGQDAKTLAGSLGQVQSDMAQLVGVIEQYEAQVKAFQETVRNLRANIVTIVWGIVLFLTFILLWLAATMLMTLFKGLEWMGFKFHLPET